jgi:hypothetical protein
LLLAAGGARAIARANQALAPPLNISKYNKSKYRHPILDWVFIELIEYFSTVCVWWWGVWGLVEFEFEFENAALK